MRISKHIIVTSEKVISFCSRSSRDWKKESALTWGGLPDHELDKEKSAEAILGSGYELSRSWQRTHDKLKGRTLSCSKCCKEALALRV
jgi:hypothetical protein